MIFCDDIWKEIKMFLFRKHLWNIREVMFFNRCLYDITNQNDYYKQPLIYISSLENYSRILKIYETIHWKTIGDLMIVTYIYLPNVQNAEEYIYYTYYPSLKYDMTVC